MGGIDFKKVKPIVKTRPAEKTKPVVKDKLPVETKRESLRIIQ